MFFQVKSGWKLEFPLFRKLEFCLLWFFFSYIPEVLDDDWLQSQSIFFLGIFIAENE